MLGLPFTVTDIGYILWAIYTKTTFMPSWQCRFIPMHKNYKQDK